MCVKGEGDWTRYSQFLGYSPPLDVLGRPGDIFVDITCRTYGIFIKGAECWIEWVGVKKCKGSGKRTMAQTTHPLLFHPHNKGLTIWCNRWDVIWIPRSALRSNRRELFRRHPDQSIILAGEMIKETTLLAPRIANMYDEEQERLHAHALNPLAINIQHTALRRSTGTPQVETPATLPTMPQTVRQSTLGFCSKKIHNRNSQLF